MCELRIHDPELAGIILGTLRTKKTRTIQADDVVDVPVPTLGPAGGPVQPVPPADDRRPSTHGDGRQRISADDEPDAYTVASCH